jgi:hypothetical protein
MFLIYPWKSVSSVSSVFDVMGCSINNQRPVHRNHKSPLFSLSLWLSFVYSCEYSSAPASCLDCADSLAKFAQNGNKMKKLIFLMGISLTLNALSLQEVYDTASGDGEYDKILNLSDTVSYTGGFIQDVEKVKILGNGAYLDLQGDSIVVSGEGKILDVERLVFHNSLSQETIFLHYRDNASGVIRHNTFYGKYGYGRANGGVRFTHCLADTSILQNNIFAGLTEPVYFVCDTALADEQIPLHIAWNILYDCCSSYMVHGGGEGPARYFVPFPGDGELFEEIGFSDEYQLDLSLGRYSPCVDAGLDWGQPFWGNGPDMGALESDKELYHGQRVQGAVSGRWSPWEGPYIVMDDMTVPAGELLSISSGTEIRLNYGKKIIVEGALECYGEYNEPVTFKRNSVFLNRWGSLEFRAGGISMLGYVQFHQGGLGDTLIYVKDAQLILADTEFSDTISVTGPGQFSFLRGSFTGKLLQKNGVVEIHHSHLQNTQIEVLGGSASLAWNVIEGLSDFAPVTLAGGRLQSIANDWHNLQSAIHQTGGYLSSQNDLIQNVQYPYTIRGINTSASLINNTIWGMKGAVSVKDTASLTLLNSIIWSDTDDAEYAILSDSSANVTAAYCNSYEQLLGEGHIYEAPLFIDVLNSNFRPDSLSPVINAGIPDTTGLMLWPWDIYNEPRISGSRVDIGAAEFQYSEPTLIAPIPESADLITLYPNPFNGSQKIKIVMTSPIRSICVYNLQGRLVRELFHGESDTRRYEGTFDGKNQFGDALPSGIYLLQAKSENSFLNRRILLLK